MASRKGRPIDGVVLLDKPAGLSSNHALQRVKRALNARKAGHTGTLDPFATGLLICCLGRATKLATQLLEADKAYVATLQLGVETDSGDLTGTVVSRSPQNLSAIDLTKVNTVLPAFRGSIEQIPPMHSALKKDGKPLYHYARQGITLERPPRQVRIDELAVVELAGDTLTIQVRCSKGTYIRTLAQDIGRALGCGAHLLELRRTEIDPFHVDQSIALADLQALAQSETAVLCLEDLPDSVQLP